MPSVPVTACCAPTTSLFNRDCKRAGLRAGEERDRHALHVVEQRDPQVVDEAFADAGRVVALHEREGCVGERETDGDERDPHHDAVAIPVRDRGVDERPDEQRRESGGDRAGDHGDDEEDQLPPVGLDVGEDAAHDDAVDPALLDGLVAPEAHHRAVFHHRRSRVPASAAARGSLVASRP